jgi:hypothetical protein
MADAGTRKTRTVMVGASADAGALADNTSKSITALQMLDVFVTLFCSVPAVEKTSSYTLTEEDCVIFANHASTTIEITLPTAVGRAGRYFVVKRTGAALVTILRSGSETIDGATSVDISQINQSVKVISDGTNWKIIGDSL